MTRRFRCAICGYIHEGDAPPDDCPVCGADRDAFVPELDDTSAPASRPDSKMPPVRLPEADSGAGPRWIVLGGGIAGLSAVEAARDSNSDALITLVHREVALPYERLSLTRYLAGDLLKEHLAMRPATWFEERRVRLIHAEARFLDRARHRVILDTGQEIPYDRLVVATGAHPFVPTIPGVHRYGVHVLRTLEDADAILSHARRGARCLCIGGGLLGLETAGGLARRGLGVTVLEEGRWLLRRQLAQSAAGRLAYHLGEIGINIRTEARVAEIVGDETVQAALLADGMELPAELVVIAAGVRPNVNIARSAGLAVNRAIVVDDSLRTSDPEVLAAGDAAEHRGVTWGLWSVALEQGRLAGRALSGAPVAFDGKPPATQLKVLDWPVFSVGRFEIETPEDRVIEKTDQTRLLRIVLNSEGAVAGGNLIGDATLAPVLRRAVQEQLKLSALPELNSLMQ